jgi:hypothetical protein
MAMLLEPERDPREAPTRQGIDPLPASIERAFGLDRMTSIPVSRRHTGTATITEPAGF